MAVSASDPPLKAGDPILLENTKGRFDFLRLDNSHRWLLLAHTGNKSLRCIRFKYTEATKIDSHGAAQDSAIDSKNGRYYVQRERPAAYGHYRCRQVPRLPAKLRFRQLQI